MPDIFPQSICFETDLTVTSAATELIQKVDFPLVVVDTTKRLINELLAVDVDYSGMRGSDEFTAQTEPDGMVIAFAVSLSQMASDDIFCAETNAGAATGQSVGNTNIICRHQEFRVTPLTTSVSRSYIGPVRLSTQVGGLGMLIPQEFVWLNFRATGQSATYTTKLGVRLWYRQRTVKADEYLGLLASRMQLTSS
jgi:hypothetical protein